MKRHHGAGKSGVAAAAKHVPIVGERLSTALASRRMVRLNPLSGGSEALLALGVLGAVGTIGYLIYKSTSSATAAAAATVNGVQTITITQPGAMSVPGSASGTATLVVPAGSTITSVTPTVALAAASHASGAWSVGNRKGYVYSVVWSGGTTTLTFT